MIIIPPKKIKTILIISQALKIMFKRTLMDTLINRRIKIVNNGLVGLSSEYEIIIILKTNIKDKIKTLSRTFTLLRLILN